MYTTVHVISLCLLSHALADVYHMSTADFIARAGYPVQMHNVTTADGYILTLHRIPCTAAASCHPVPVLLQHGFLASSFDWVVQPSPRSLAYQLASRHRDVWLGNFRGNTYSRAHTNSTRQHAHFWHFTWDQMAAYDLPAMVEHVLAVSGCPHLDYVAHSMGTTVYFALQATQSHRYGRKFRTVQALAPVTRLEYSRSVFRALSPLAFDLINLADTLGYGELLPSNRLIKTLSRYACSDKSSEITRRICENIVFLFSGADAAQINRTALAVILAHTPAGSSSRTLLQYLQLMRTHRFSHFDWGARENQRRYGSDSPPDYQLARVRGPPLVLYWAENDAISHRSDVQWLADQLRVPVTMIRVPYERFNHVDFVWAEDADWLLYSSVVRHIEAADTHKHVHYVT